MNVFFDEIKKNTSFNAVAAAIKENKTPIVAYGCADTQKSHVISALDDIYKGAKLIVTYSELRAKEMCHDPGFFAHERVFHYPSKDIVFYWADVKSNEIVKKRFEVTSRLLKGENIIVVACVDALFDRLSAPEKVSKYIYQIDMDTRIDIQQLSEKLILEGYERCSLVEGQGQFSVRGDIIDIFSPVNENPVRIELFGDEIDSIRIFDVQSQKTIEKRDKATIYPMRELIYDNSDIEDACKNILSAFSKIKNPPDRLKEKIKEALELLETQKSFSGVDSYIQFFKDTEYSLMDYFPDESIVFVDEPSRVKEHSDFMHNEFAESVRGRILEGEMLPEQLNLIYDYEKYVDMLLKKRTVLMSSFIQQDKYFKPQTITSFNVKSTLLPKNNIDSLCEDLNAMLSYDYRVIYMAGGHARCERMFKELTDRNISAVLCEDVNNVPFEKPSIYIIRGGLTHGFEYPEQKLAIVSDSELFETNKKSVRRTRKDNSSPIKSYQDLKPGDYVVHENHGIAIYNGIEKIVTDGIVKDYLKLEYAENAILYVSINQMDRVQKYIGGEFAKPHLNNLSKNNWSKAKQKAKENIEEIADDLVKLYAKRQNVHGYCYGPDTVWQKEFEESFEFTETSDQLDAIEDVKKDMESGKVMDRLICGDVGYGKTEVALRAAFKTVEEGKQVAFLVPTTILCKQHYLTFKERMNDFPIRVDMLSRFNKASYTSEVKKAIKTGECDIVIGTHKLLGKDVEFKDLGLIIIDEEQRFGVRHKEKLKKLRESVNVLTLSATPIPRTMHMSLTGIRDMSLLEEPPQDRIPIQTYVMEYTPAFIRDAIHRELARNGQVYFLHNRVYNIDDTAEKIQKLVPEAKIGVAHGQMTERELENVMMDFIDNEINVLVCTTIVETGLDIPNVNTIIIDDADKMGLGQLYQLRGRVGRSTRASYAYLLYQKDKVLSEQATKRLQTIKEFTEFGSGFRIAMRDLEIRGAGNMLGAAQHGHLDSIGYELYTKLLSEAILAAKGEKKQEDFVTQIEVNISAYIPTDYIENELIKLEMYKKISYIENKDDYYRVADELTDRFGTIPKNTENLLSVAYIKAMAHKAGVSDIKQKGHNVLIYFEQTAQNNTERLVEMINREPKRLKITNSGKLSYLTLTLADIKGVLKELTNFFEELNK